MRSLLRVERPSTNANLHPQSPHVENAGPCSGYWSDANVKLLGLAEVLGAVGLIVPWLTGIAPVLTPVAAVALTVIMGGAVKTHVDRKEPLVPPAVLGALCVFIALGRFGVL